MKIKKVSGNYIVLKERDKIKKLILDLKSSGYDKIKIGTIAIYNFGKYQGVNWKKAREVVIEVLDEMGIKHDSIYAYLKEVNK